MPPLLLTVACVALAAGAVPVLTWWGLGVLGERGRWPRARVVAPAAGVVAGLAAAGGYSLGGWWALPGFAVWACAIASAACCDLVTLRMPTPLLRHAAAATLVLVAAASLLGRHSPAALLGGVVAALALAGLVWLGWRFGPVGRGDVRLALLGGLPLGFAGSQALVPAVAAFVAVSLAQSAAALARGAGRKTQLPFGPALAAAFLATAVFA